MHGGVVNEVEQDLAQGARVGVTEKSLTDGILHDHTFIALSGLEVGQIVVDEALEFEAAPALRSLIDGHLLEALDQLGRLGDGLQRQLTHLLGGLDKLFQSGAADRLCPQLGGQLSRSLLQGRGGDQGIADRGVQLVRDPRHHGPQCRQGFGVDQFFLGLFQAL